MQIGELTVRLKTQLNSKELEDAAKKTEERFKKVNQKFTLGLKSAIGNGIKGGLKGGAIASAIAVVGALLDTGYAKVEAKLNEILGVGDDISTLTGQLKREGVNITSGEVAGLRAVASQSGVDSDVLVKSLVKFMDAQKKGTAEVQGFNTGNTVQDFLDFFKTLSTIQDGSQRQAVLGNVFGQREGVALMELSQANIDEAVGVYNKALKQAGVSITEYSKKIDKLGRLEGLQAQEKVLTELLQIKGVADNIDEVAIQAQATVERAKNKADIDKMQNFTALTQSEAAQVELMNDFKKFVNSVQETALPTLKEAFEKIKALVEFVGEIKGKISAYVNKFFGGR